MKINQETKRKNQAKNEIRTNVLTEDQLLIERLRSYFSRRGSVYLIFSAEPLAEHEVDCYVVQASKIKNIFTTKNKQKTWLPIIAFGSHFHLKQAFWAGCTDFIKEPWEPLELEIRVKKCVKEQLNNYYFHDEKLLIKGNICSTSFNSVTLSFQESLILKTLLKQRGSVVPREVLFYTIWHELPPKKSRAVDMHISSLRKKLISLFPFLKKKQLIISARGTGYMLV